MNSKQFWDRIDVGHPLGCWVWTGAIGHGYGTLRVGERHVMAHRYAWSLLRGPLPVHRRRQLDHLCRNRACVNPDHLELVPQRVNIERGHGLGVVNAAKTHCPQGHPYDAANTYRWRTSRICRTCTAVRSKAYYAKQRKAVV